MEQHNQHFVRKTGNRF